MARNRGRRLAQPLPLPKDTVLCGELTLDPSQPHNNVLPFPSDVPLDIRSTTFQNLHNSQTTAVGAEFWAQLLTFLKAQAHALHLDHVTITVPQGTKYLVRNSETSFKIVCGNSKVRAWLEEHVIDEGRNAAMILGGQLSVSDPNNNAGSANQSATIAAFNQQTFNVPGEQIFAIEYKPIKFKRWSKKKIEDAKLEEGQNRWEVFFGDRTKGTAAEGKENIFEFDLDDDGNENPADEFDDMDSEEGQSTTESMKFKGSNADEV